MAIDLIKVLLPAVVSFWVGIILAPLLTHYLYAYKVWKKAPGKTALDGAKAIEFEKLRSGTETKTPRMGGILVWASVLATVAASYILARIFPGTVLANLDFLSRSQTWVPLSTLILGSLVGFINDVLDVIDSDGERGIPLRVRLLFVSILSLLVGLWFFIKLDVVTITIPLLPDLYLGWGIVPFFIFVSLCLYASGVIDGIDGLSGGVFASIFGAYAFIAFNQNQLDLAALSATVVGALLAFLWFNVPPARFWMTETGTMGLTLMLASIAFMTDSLGEGRGVSALPIIAFLLVATVASNVIQILSKKFLKRKVFKIAPLHHHFEAIGWPGYKVTMRYWILSLIFAILGVAYALVR